MDHASAIDHDVQRGELFDRLLEGSRDGRFVSYVAGREDRLAAGAADRADDLLAPVRLHVGNRDAGPFRGEQLGHGRADAAGTAADPGNLPRQSFGWHRKMAGR